MGVENRVAALPLIWILCWSFTDVLGVQAELVEPPLESDPDPVVQLSQHWGRYIEAKRARDTVEQRQALDQIREMRNGMGAVVFEDFSLLFLQEGYRDLDLGEFEKARQEFLMAAQLDPYLWPAYLGLARVKKLADHNWKSYLALSIKGIRSAIDFRNCLFVLDAVTWFLQRLMLFFQLALVVLVFLLCVVYVRPFFETTRQALEQRGLKPTLALILSLGILLSPLILGFNLLLLAGLYLALFVPFFSGREKAVAFVSLLVYAASGCLVMGFMVLQTAHSHPDFQLQMTHFFRGSLEPQLERVAARVEREGDDNTLLRFAYADLLKTAGQLAEAREQYELIPQQADFWPHAQVNLGNIYFGWHEIQKAISCYESARNHAQTQGVALYNLSVAKGNLGEHGDAERLLGQAKAADRRVMDRIMLRGDVELNRLMDAEFDPVQALKQAFWGRYGPGFDVLFRQPFVLAPFGFSLLVLILALIHLRFRNPRLLAKACDKCGNLYYQSESPNHAWCSQCVNLYVRKGDLPSEAKMKKYDEVQAWNARKRRLALLLQLVVPGSKSILRGSAWAGFFVVGFWVLLVVASLSHLSEIHHPSVSFIHDFLILQVFFWGSTLFYWVIFGLRGIWQED